MSENGSPLSFSGRRQLEIGTTNLATLTGGIANGATVAFAIRNPDSRCRLKLSIMFVPVGGGAVGNVGAKGLKLWLFAGDKDRSGASGAIVPITDLDGSTKAAPISIPKSAGLGGYSYEATTAADYLGGEVTIPNQLGDSLAGTLVLQVQLQPDGLRLLEDEWQEVRSEFRNSPPASPPTI